MKHTIVIVTIIALFTLSSYSSWRSYTHAANYQSHSKELANQHSIEKIVGFQLEQLVNLLSLGLVDSDTLTQYEQTKKLQLIEKNKALTWTYIALGILFVTILIAKIGLRENLYLLVLSINGLIALGVGVFAPIMTLIVQKNIDYLGTVVLSFESKGVLSTIEKLFSQEEWVVALAVLLFSVLLPLGKIMSLFLVSLWIDARWTHKLMNFFKMLGKWSMVDVFIVAIFLVYLTGQKSDTSEAYTGIGLYFFLGYVLISILATIESEAILQKRVL